MTYARDRRKQMRRINRKFVEAGFNPRNLEPGERRIGVSRCAARPFTPQELGLPSNN